jgi:hypothetical protein
LCRGLLASASKAIDIQKIIWREGELDSPSNLLGETYIFAVLGVVVWIWYTNLGGSTASKYPKKDLKDFIIASFVYEI